jgi:hypothetical protein
MKKIIVVAVALFTLNIAVAENPIKPSEELRSDIIQLIGTESPFDFEKDESTVEVIFTVNSKNEIIVLYADTKNQEMENFIKNKLNYKKVNFKDHKNGELFLLPVKFKNS